MAKDAWLPRSHKLADGSRVYSLLFTGVDWQIFDRKPGGTILVVRPALAQRWCEVGLLDKGLLGTLSFGAESYRTLGSDGSHALVPLNSDHSPSNKVDAMAFSIALKESRRLSGDVSLHDALYVEQYSRVLPTWTLTPAVADDVVLGTWLTGGVVVSTNSFRRLCTLAGWMPAADLAQVIVSAGLCLTSEANVLVKSLPKGGRETTSEREGTKARQGTASGEAAAGDKSAKVFTLPGRPQLEAFFNEHVIDIISNGARYQALGIEFPSAIVLHGPSGCGKTFAVDRLVEFLDLPSFSIDSNSVGSPYIHETSKKISELFDKAIEAAPSVIVIDEMESFLTDRRSGGLSGLHHVEEVAEFLRRIPEAISRKVLIIAMTNLVEMIDPAILRRGRFDHIVEVGMPSKDEVAALLEALFSKLPQTTDLSLNELAVALAGRPLSDAAFVVREAARLAGRNGRAEVDQESVAAAIASLPPAQVAKARQIGFGKAD